MSDTHRATRPRHATLADADLLAAMRREDPRAVAELYRRFAPLLRRRAARWRVPGASCDDIVDDVLADAALALMRPGAAVPRSLAAYLLVALRHRLANARRTAELRERRALDAAEPEHALA
ncbi:MAG TPA: sigma factor, partial [Gemmatimonadales bacterium]